MLSSVTNCPVAVVPAPPAVSVMDPSALITPARSPAVPAALEVCCENALTSPTVGPEVTSASPSVNETEYEKASPAVAWVTVGMEGAPNTPSEIVPRPPSLLSAEAPPPISVFTPLPEVLKEFPSLVA